MAVRRVPMLRPLAPEITEDARARRSPQRSSDDGETWEENDLHVETDTAKRTAGQSGGHLFSTLPQRRVAIVSRFQA
jgi:hypothetical protein